MTAQKLRLELVRLNRKSKDVAKELGITPQYLSYLVRGKRPISKKFEAKFSKLLEAA